MLISLVDMGLSPVSCEKKGERRPKEQQWYNVSLQTQLEYARNGHTSLCSFLDPPLLRDIRTDLVEYASTKTLAAWRQKVEVASDSSKLAQSCHSVEQCRQELDRLGVPCDSLPFLQHFNTWRSVPSVHKLAVQLGQTAATLLDVSSVKLYQDSLFWKRSGDGPTPWHTDARMAPFDTQLMLTFWIPLQDIPKDGTALVFVSKSHSDFALPFWNDFDNGPEYNRLEERYGGETVHYMPMNVGDVTVHSGWTLHCADGSDNEQDGRLALAITYVDAKAEIRENVLQASFDGGGGYGDNEDYWSYKEWVSEVPPRQRFQHDLVPIVWPPPCR